MNRQEKPFIAVTVPVEVAQDAPVLNAVTGNGYLKGAEIAQGAPLVLPPTLEAYTARNLLAMADGLILTGGGDVDPAQYGEQGRDTRNVSPERDDLEMAAAEWALENDVPILAICRGMQLLNVVLGGSLFQNLGAQTEAQVDHDRAGKEVSRAVHPIRVEGAVLLEGVFDGEEFHSNSTHHQGIRELGEGLIPVAWSEDGVVEAVEYRDGSQDTWVVGVQWHPERMLDESTGTNRRLFERFGRAVERRADRRR